MRDTERVLIAFASIVSSYKILPFYKYPYPNVLYTSKNENLATGTAGRTEIVRHSLYLFERFIVKLFYNLHLSRATYAVIITN